MNSVKNGSPNYTIRTLIQNLQEDIKNDSQSESSDYLIMLTSELN